MKYGWQSDRAMWSLIPSDLRDSAAWRSVGFTEMEATSVPADQAGVYCFCASPVGRRFPQRLLRGDLFSNLLTPLYVGRTDNLRRRFVQHCRRPSAGIDAVRRCFGPSLLFWFHRRDEGQIQEDEAALILCFGPTANERTERIKATVGRPIAIGVHKTGS